MDFFKKILILFSIIIFISGCILISKKPNYTFTTPPFDLDEYSKSNKCFLDTNSYYYRKYLVFDGYPLYTVLKFSSTGRVRTTFFRHFPSEVELDTTQNEKNQLDYYKIEDNILEMEKYFDARYGMVYWKGSIYSDSIKFFISSNFNKTTIYKKYPLPLDYSEW